MKDPLCPWFDIGVASSAFLRGAETGVELISCEISLPEKREITAYFKSSTGRRIFYCTAMCGGGASALEDICQKLGKRARHKVQKEA